MTRGGASTQPPIVLSESLIFRPAGLRYLGSGAALFASWYATMAYRDVAAPVVARIGRRSITVTDGASPTESVPTQR